MAPPAASASSSAAGAADATMKKVKVKKKAQKEWWESSDEDEESSDEEAPDYDENSPLRLIDTLSTQDIARLASVNGLSDLYEILPSPRPDANLSKYPPAVAAFMANLVDCAEPLANLRTTLHPYQRRTLAVMLQREYAPDGLQGGILAEEMGTGKTVECLSLISATRGSIPDVPPEDSFGTPEGHITIKIQSATSRSLRDMCIRRIRLNRGTSMLAGQEELPDHLFRQLWQARPYFQRFLPYTARSEFSRNPIREPQATTVFLSCATLVITPATLQSHWTGEIDKHILSLRVLVVGQSDVIPPPELLASDWDVVLMSFERFAKEADVVLSQLARLRWRRLVVDEGNKLSGSSRLVDLATTQLQFQSRWMVSGTPAEALIGTGSTNWSAVEQAASTSPSESPPPAAIIRRPWTKDEKKDIDERLFRLIANFLRTPPFYDIDLVAYGHEPLFWAKQRWSEFVSKPLFPDKNIPPTDEGIKLLFAILCKTMVRNQPADVAKDRPLPPLHRHYVPVHLSEPERKSYNVLQALIAANAALSEREGEDYFFHPSNRKWLIQIISNLSLACLHFAPPDRVAQARDAIQLLSRRLEDEKWKGSKELEEALAQLQAAVDDREWARQGADVAYKIEGLSKEIVNAWTWRQVPGSDRLAASDVLRAQKAFGEVVTDHRDSALDDLDELIQEEMITRGVQERHKFIADEQSRRASEEEVRKIREEYEKDGYIFSGDQTLKYSAKHVHAQPNKSKKDMEVNAKLRLLGSAAASSLDDHVLHNKHKSSKAATTTASTGDHEEDPLPPWLRLPATSPFLNTRITSLSSTKLLALISMLGTHSAPTLIFSSQDNSLYEISACLDVLSLNDARFRHRIFTSGVKQATLDRYVAMFKSGELDILLIKTDKGSKGLDLYRATRVVFVEPEGTPSVERQAIKRAWRQGQERAVDVYYLYAVGTFEERITNMMRDKLHSRGGASSGDSIVRTTQQVAPGDGGVVSLLADPVMRDFVAYPKYIPAASKEETKEREGGARLSFGLFAPAELEAREEGRRRAERVRQEQRDRAMAEALEEKVKTEENGESAVSGLMDEAESASGGSSAIRIKEEPRDDDVDLSVVGEEQDGTSSSTSRDHRTKRKISPNKEKLGFLPISKKAATSSSTGLGSKAKSKTNGNAKAIS